MVQGTGRRPRCAEVYTDSDHAGWDEVCPSVEPCHDPRDGRAIPDHGDLWARSWTTVDVGPARIVQRIEIPDGGYALERSIDVEGPRLLARYLASATYAGPRLWLFHAQFAPRPGTRLTVDVSARDTFDVTDPDRPTAVTWPGDFVLERDVAAGRDRRFAWVAGAGPYAARLADPEGPNLAIRAAGVSHLAVWADRGLYSDGAVVAIEPTNALAESLEVAYRHRAAPIWGPDATREWSIEMEVGGDT